MTYFHTYIDGVDIVFIDSPIFRNLESNIYGGNRLVIFDWNGSCTSISYPYYLSLLIFVVL